MASSGKTHRTLTMKHVEGKPGKVYYPLEIKIVPSPIPTTAGQLLVRPTHLSLNHRDFFLRQALYPSPSFETPLLSDAVAEVVTSGTSPGSGPRPGSRVLFVPIHGWAADPAAPETPYTLLGGTRVNKLGTAQDLVLVDEKDTVPCPEHLTGEQAAALPLVGLTGWRALVTKAGVTKKDQNILITGIGGGVATIVLLFAVAMGVRAWVTSGDGDKIVKAMALGASGGISYKLKDWDKRLSTMLPKDRPFFDAVIDGAGGDIVDRTVRLLKEGGSIVSYGMTLGPKMPTSMVAVMKNIDVRGSTMGSRAEFDAMVAFVAAHKIRPVVSCVVEADLADLSAWEALFDDMKAARQFGKLVFKVKGAAKAGKQGKGAKL